MRALLLAALLAATARAQAPDGLAGTWTVTDVIQMGAPPGTLLALPGLRSVVFSTAGTAVVRLSVEVPVVLDADSLRRGQSAALRRLGVDVEGDTLAVGSATSADGRSYYARTVPGESLVGLWRFARTAGGRDGRRDTAGIELSADGTVTLLFDSVSPFTVEGDRLSIAMDVRDGPPTQDATLHLDGDTLRLMQDGATAVFRRTPD